MISRARRRSAGPSGLRQPSQAQSGRTSPVPPRPAFSWTPFLHPPPGTRDGNAPPGVPSDDAELDAAAARCRPAAPAAAGVRGRLRRLSARRRGARGLVEPRRRALFERPRRRGPRPAVLPLLHAGRRRRRRAGAGAARGGRRRTIHRRSLAAAHGRDAVLDHERPHRPGRRARLRPGDARPDRAAARSGVAGKARAALLRPHREQLGRRLPPLRRRVRPLRQPIDRANSRLFAARFRRPQGPRPGPPRRSAAHYEDVRPVRGQPGADPHHLLPLPAQGRPVDLAGGRRYEPAGRAERAGRRGQFPRRDSAARGGAGPFAAGRHRRVVARRHHRHRPGRRRRQLEHRGRATLRPHRRGNDRPVAVAAPAARPGRRDARPAGAAETRRDDRRI